jgi:hypothetical protein
MIASGDRRPEAVTSYGRQIKLQRESVMAEVCLHVSLTGLYTLVGIGLVIVFM